MAKIRVNNAGKIVAWLIHAVSMTLKFRVINRAGISAFTPQPHIWVFWHNRMFVVPWIGWYMFNGRRGGILTSPSGDGEIIAQACEEFLLKPVRGSSSRRGAKAMREMVEIIQSGLDLAITPDGPRGPCYNLNMGVIKLAQLTGASILPVHVRYDRAIRFKTWDGFLLPVPFTGVEVEFGKTVSLPRDMTEEECEAQRLALERALVEGTVGNDAP